VESKWIRNAALTVEDTLLGERTGGQDSGGTGRQHGSGCWFGRALSKHREVWFASGAGTVWVKRPQSDAGTGCRQVEAGRDVKDGTNRSDALRVAMLRSSPFSSITSHCATRPLPLGFPLSVCSAAAP
jgi:hypothetical protein